MKYISFLLKFGRSYYRDILSLVIFIVIRFDLPGLFVLLNMRKSGNILKYINKHHKISSHGNSVGRKKKTRFLVLTDQIMHKLILHKSDLIILNFSGSLPCQEGLFVDTNKPVISVLFIPN